MAARYVSEEGRLAERVERGQDHSRGRRGKPVEVPLGFSPLLDVEAGQSNHDGHHVNQGEHPAPGPVGEIQRIHDEGGRDPEGDCVHQRVQLPAEGGSRSGEAGDAPVEQIRDGSPNDEPPGPLEVPPRGGHDGIEPEEKARHRERRRQDDDASLEPPGRSHPIDHVVPSRPSIHAKTVDPPATLSPTAQSRLHASGMKRSTLDPNRMRPMRSPHSTCSPCSGYVTIRRARSPAIWRTSTRWSRAIRPREDCSFLSLAFGCQATAYSPGRYSRCATSPEIGARCTWTLKTLRKIVMRRHAPFTKEGSSTSRISMILPSPGEITTPSGEGSWRSGSRKK